MLTDPDLHPLAVEDHLSTDDGMEVELLDLWLPPLDSEPSPQLPQQLSQTVKPLQPSTAVQGPPSYLLLSAQGQLPAVAVRPIDGMAPLQRMAAIASNFQQKTSLIVCPALVHAAADTLALANQLMPNRRQKTLDAAVLWIALQLYPHEKGRNPCARHFAAAAAVSASTLATVSNMLRHDIKFTTALHMEMYKQWIAAGDSERQFSPEPHPASRGIKRGREESARSPSEQHASDDVSVAEDATFFPMQKKIHVGRSQLTDDCTGVQLPAESFQPTAGQLLFVMPTRHCKNHLNLALPHVVVPDIKYACLHTLAEYLHISLSIYIGM